MQSHFGSEDPARTHIEVAAAVAGDDPRRVVGVRWECCGKVGIDKDEREKDGERAS